MTTAAQAYTDTMQKLATKWATTGLPIKYSNIPLDAAMQTAIDTGDTAWARVTYKPNLRDQTSLASSGNAKYTAQGIVIVDIFTPTGDGGTLARTLYSLVETAWEGVSTPNGVWYRNVRTSDEGQDGHYWHTQTIAEWSYDEVR